MSKIIIPRKSEVCRAWKGVRIENTWVNLSRHTGCLPIDILLVINGYLPLDNRSGPVLQWAERRSGKSRQGLLAYWNNFRDKYSPNPTFSTKETTNLVWNFLKKNNLTKPSGKYKKWIKTEKCRTGEFYGWWTPIFGYPNGWSSPWELSHGRKTPEVGSKSINPVMLENTAFGNFRMRGYNASQESPERGARSWYGFTGEAIHTTRKFSYTYFVKIVDNGDKRHYLARLPAAEVFDEEGNQILSNEEILKRMRVKPYDGGK